MAPLAMLVIVIVPNAPTKVWSTLTTGTPSIVTVAGPSGAAKFIVPAVVSLFDAAFEPAGRPASLTNVPASSSTGRSRLTGLSAIAMVNVAVEGSPSPSVMV